MTIEATSPVHAAGETSAALYVWECGVAALAEARAITADDAIDILRRDLSRSGPYDIRAVAENLIMVRHSSIGGSPSYWTGTPVVGRHPAINDIESALVGKLSDKRRAALSGVLRALVDGTDPADDLARLLDVPAQRAGA